MATRREHVREKIIVHAKSLNIWPMMPRVFLNMSIGAKIQIEVRVEPVIDMTIS